MIEALTWGLPEACAGIRGFFLCGGHCGVLPAGCDTLLLPAQRPMRLWFAANHVARPAVRARDAYTSSRPDPRIVRLHHPDRRIWRPSPPPEITFGIGDVVSVSIFEAAAGGLFIPAEAVCAPATSSRYRTSQ